MTAAEARDITYSSSAGAISDIKRQITDAARKGNTNISFYDKTLTDAIRVILEKDGYTVSDIIYSTGFKVAWQ